MVVGINLPSNKKMSIKNNVLAFKKPNYVYIPLVNHTNLDCKPLVSVGDQVYKGSIVGLRNDKFALPIHSSVSGKVIGIEEGLYLNGKKVKCVVIENDFKEKVENKNNTRRDISNYTKQEFITILKNCGVIGMGGSGFPTYIKYDVNEPIHTLVINGIECEPYITADYTLMREKADEILESIDAILEINSIPKAIIAIKIGHPEIKDAFDQYMGTYPNIELVEVEDMYPMGWEKNLIKRVLNVNYKKYPIEKGIVVNNISTIYAIYEALKYNKPVIERMITVTGESIKKPQNVIVKIGTKATDVIEFIGGIKKTKQLKLIAGGPMMGVSVASDELIISNNLNCLLLIENTNNSSNISCMRCGKCVSVCPSKLSPVLIKNALNNKDQLEYLEPKRCVECGLCSYICPSKIDVREYVRKAKETIEVK